MRVPYYETVVVVDPTGEEGIADKHLSKVKELVEKKDGKVLKVEQWGRRKLAYSIKHRREGIYFMVEFEAPGDTVRILEQYYRLQESILRYLTVGIDKPSEEGTLSPIGRESRSDVREVEQEKPAEEEKPKRTKTTESPQESKQLEQSGEPAIDDEAVEEAIQSLSEGDGLSLEKTSEDKKE